MKVWEDWNKMAECRKCLSTAALRPFCFIYSQTHRSITTANLTCVSRQETPTLLVLCAWVTTWLLHICCFMQKSVSLTLTVLQRRSVALYMVAVFIHVLVIHAILSTKQKKKKKFHAWFTDSTGMFIWWGKASTCGPVQAHTLWKLKVANCLKTVHIAPEAACSSKNSQCPVLCGNSSLKVFDSVLQACQEWYQQFHTIGYSQLDKVTFAQDERGHYIYYQGETDNFAINGR